MYPLTRSRCAAEASGPRAVVFSNGSPTTIAVAAAPARVSASARRDLGTNMRVSARQVCPLFKNAPPTPDETAFAKVASSRSAQIMLADFPPSSSATFLTVSAAT